MAKKKKNDKLTANQELFCREYIIDRNGTRAYLDVYGCSQKAAESGAARSLGIAKVKARVKELLGKVMEKQELKAADVIGELRKLGFSNIKNYLGDNNQILDISQIGDDQAAAVESVQSTRTITQFDDGSENIRETTKLKLYDKRSALVDLGRHLGIFEKDNEQSSGVNSLLDVIALMANKKAKNGSNN